MARWLVLIGLTIMVIGLVLQFTPSPLSWFGRLPGDIRIETERGRLFFPITSMLVVSGFLTLLVHLLRR